MKNALIFCLFISCAVIKGYAQKAPAYNPETASKALKEQANLAATALIKKDYKTFCNYTYPKLLTMAGGREKMAQALQQTMDQIKSQGVEISGFNYGEVGKAYKVGDVWQSTIVQHTKMKIPNGNLTTTSTLIAFSADNGKNWTFLDTNNKDIATVRKIIPELSPSITIPPPQAPVRSAN